MKLLIVTLATIFTFGGFCESCRPAEGHEWKSIAELTKLAPLVLHANVVARGKQTIYQWEYNATLNVIQVYKGTLNETQIVVAGFGNSASCRSEVFVLDEKIFFLDVNPFRARYDDIHSAVATYSSETVQEILEGLCCPYTPDCPRQNTCDNKSTPTPQNPTPTLPTPTLQNTTPTIQNPTTLQNQTPIVQNPTPTIQNPTPTIQNPTPTLQNPTPTTQKFTGRGCMTTVTSTWFLIIMLGSTI